MNFSKNKIRLTSCNLKKLLDESSYKILFLDYDGTLTKLVTDADSAFLSKKNFQSLRDFIESQKINDSSIITGRGMDSLLKVLFMKNKEYIEFFKNFTFNNNSEKKIMEDRKINLDLEERFNFFSKLNFSFDHGLSLYSQIKKETIKFSEQSSIYDIAERAKSIFEKEFKNELSSFQNKTYSFIFNLKPEIFEKIEEKEKIKYFIKKNILENNEVLRNDFIVKEVINGFEVINKKVNKGAPILFLLGQRSDKIKEMIKNKRVLIISAGDENTDEDMFGTLKKYCCEIGNNNLNLVNIKILSPNESDRKDFKTKANYFVESQEEFIQILSKCSQGKI